jgi:hypothetical protein
MTTTQLELPFIEEDPNLRAARAEERFKSFQDKMRKVMYARLGEEKKKRLELEHEFELLKQAICKNQMEFKF